MKSQRFFSLLLVLTLPLTLLSGCAKTEPETPAEPPKLEEGVAAQSAEDFALIDGELWVIEEGEVRSAGNRENSVDLPDGFSPAFLSSDGELPVVCSTGGELFWDGETTLLPCSPPSPRPEILRLPRSGISRTDGARETASSSMTGQPGTPSPPIPSVQGSAKSFPGTIKASGF